MTYPLKKIMHNGDEYDFPSLPEWWTQWQIVAMSSNWPVWVDVDSPTSISLNESSISLSTAWDTYQLTATISPSSAIITQVYWTSDDESIATVDSTWLVTCVTPWTCTITATTINWMTATCWVSKWWYLIDVTDVDTTTTYTVNWATWFWGIYSLDGTKFFGSNRSSWVVWKELSTPYDLSTVTNTITQSPWWDIHQVFLSWDGTRAGFATWSWFIWVWELTTPRDFSTRTNYQTKNSSNCTWMSFNNDGTMLYMQTYQTDIKQYSLATARDITSTATLVGTLSTDQWDERWVSFTSDWQYMLCTDWGISWWVVQYELSTPRDITTATVYKKTTSPRNMANFLLDDSWFVTNGTSNSKIDLYKFKQN